jgi:hypothetical protein
MRAVTLLLLIFLGALLAMEAVFSLSWPIAHDEAPLLYEAFLMQAEGRLPYRDLFDFQMPGAYAAFYALGRLSDFEPLRIRILDLTLLAGLMAITYRWMRRFGWPAAVATISLFGLKYLQGGPSMALQREFLLLIPVATGVWLWPRQGQSAAGRVVIGACLGLATLIKPNAAVALLPVLVMEMGAGERSRGKATVMALLATSIGFVIPLVVALGWMQVTGILVSFLDIAVNYWPLYSQINGQLVVTSGGDRWVQALDQAWRMGGNMVWLLPAALGFYLTRADTRLAPLTRRHINLLTGLSVAFAIYPALSGQFFQYHYLPFIYFITALASLCLFQLRDRIQQLGALLVLLMAIMTNVELSPVIIGQIEGKSLTTGRAEQLAAYLSDNLRPGQTVQPLDWTGGTLQAMLDTRASLATPFVFDFYLYHHVSQPFIQDLRVRFMQALEAAAPEYILEVTAMDKPWVSGPDTSRAFPALEQFLAGGYALDAEREGYRIYRRR